MNALCESIGRTGKLFAAAAMVTLTTAACAQSEIGFEAPYTAGAIEGQQGWRSSYFGSFVPTGATISTANPSAGLQHLRLGHSAAWTQQNLTSPVLLAPTNQPSTTSMQVSLHMPNPEFGAGADYMIWGYGAGQQPAWLFWFESTNTIRISDAMNDGGGINTTLAEVPWTTDAYREVRIEMDPAVHAIRYFYGGVLIHTGSILAASSAQTVEMIRVDPLPNFVDENYMDIDQLRAIPAAGAWTVPALAAGLCVLRRRRS